MRLGHLIHFVSVPCSRSVWTNSDRKTLKCFSTKVHFIKRQHSFINTCSMLFFLSLLSLHCFPCDRLSAVSRRGCGNYYCEWLDSRRRLPIQCLKCSQRKYFLLFVCIFHCIPKQPARCVDALSSVQHNDTRIALRLLSLFTDQADGCLVRRIVNTHWNVYVDPDVWFAAHKKKSNPSNELQELTSCVFHFQNILQCKMKTVYSRNKYNNNSSKTVVLEVNVNKTPDECILHFGINWFVRKVYWNESKFKCLTRYCWIWNVFCRKSRSLMSSS